MSIATLLIASALVGDYAVFWVTESSEGHGDALYALERVLHSETTGLRASVADGSDLPRPLGGDEGNDDGEDGSTDREIAQALVRAAETSFHAEDYKTAAQHLSAALAALPPGRDFETWQLAWIWKAALARARGDARLAGQCARTVLSADPAQLLPVKRLWPSLIGWLEEQRAELQVATVQLETPLPRATVVLDRIPLD
ncbi:MAG: hypothetical protein AAFQ82_12365 [Myxococcota bacterium]